jgi:glycerate dehydrogenase
LIGNSQTIATRRTLDHSTLRRFNFENFCVFALFTMITLSHPPRLVVLDGRTTNPGDLLWEPIAQYGDLTVYDTTEPSQLIERTKNADIIITNSTKLNADFFAIAPALQGVMVLSTGFNAVDTVAARSRNIPVCNVSSYSTDAVAQGVFALLLELTNQTGHHAAAVRSGRWSGSSDFCFWDGNLIDLAGLTLGIVGFGRIGRAVARIGQAFGMNLLITQRQPSPDSVDLATVLVQSDVVSLHCPLSPDTRGLMDATRLAQMKRTAYLINTARGGLIDEIALAHVLHNGGLAGAGLDVLSQEPPPLDHPLLTAPNCIVTPHLSWASRQTRQRLIAQVAENIAALLAGQPQNVVN